MVRFPQLLSSTLSVLLLIALNSASTLAHQAVRVQPQQDQVTPQAPETKKQKRARKAEQKAEQKKPQEPEKATPTPETSSATSEETVEVIADKQSKNGDLEIYDGYVNATQGEMRLQADHVTFNSTTHDMVAEGNVIFDQGTDQRVTARRAEINWVTKKGIFWDTTGFTNRTQTGDYVFFTAARVEKTGPDIYELYDADVTACEDVIPKWSFKTKRAELKMGDRMVMRNAVFHVKTLPAFVLPYLWIPATRRERKSGFLLPSTGNSNQKGRTLKLAYYQTLGQSADITFRGDVYTQRGLGMGAEFRAQTDEKSYLRLGVFSVKDRLFGPPGESQGGTAFIGEGVQHLGHGWLAVGNVSLVTSLAFRQVFSDDISQVIDPRRESTFYANNNTNGFSFNFLASNETTTLFTPSHNPATPSAGTNIDIKVRQAPEINVSMYPRRLFEGTPIYFSFDSSVAALKKEAAVDTNVVLVTPAAVQRFDFQPKITVPLATVAGVAITPSLALRETFYNASFDPNVTAFDADKFTFDPADPRLDPGRTEFQPGLKLFDRNALDPISTKDLSRHYAELAVDIRPPSLEKTYTNQDGTERFKHVIEPYITYRLIGGIGDQFNKIIRFDDTDTVADTNEFEYAIVNRFFTRQLSSDLTRRRRKGRALPSDMKLVKPSDKDRDPGENAPLDEAADGKSQPPAPADASADGQKERAKTDESQTTETKPKPGEPQTTETKPKLETGQQAEMNSRDRAAKREQEASARGRKGKRQSDATDALAAEDDNATTQAYEVLTVRVAQKYFFDRSFGGALIPGQRNQFYPINTLSGFTFGGVARSFSPINVAARYRPLSSVFADLRMDVGTDDGIVRDVTIGGGVRTDKLSVSADYYLSRQIKVQPNAFEAGTFPGDQVGTTIQLGDELRGLYGGARINYDFTNRFVTDTQVSQGRLMNSRSYIGYGWDCCGVQFNYNTFKAGLRSESAWSFTFTLAGLGSYGTDQFSQLGGGQGARKRGKRARSDDDYFQ
ncbi:MAG TPA: putative LPS assembly protein LptD [Blastocatellia bacterium]|nr:putative LPS assembly protein LptD [Blastocatellia bacterium]